jgi:hypothetical protein
MCCATALSRAATQTAVLLLIVYTMQNHLFLQCVVARTLQVGEFMQDVIEDHFKKAGKVATVKYIDPSYMIR